MLRPGPETGSWLVRKESRQTQVEHEWAVCTCRKMANHISGCISKKCSHQVEGRDYDGSPLFSICAGLLCPGWGFPSTRKTWTYRSKLTGEQLKCWVGRSIQCMSWGWESWVCSVLRWEGWGNGGDVIAAFSYLMSKYKERGVRLLAVEQWRDKIKSTNSNIENSN